jgi:hypothetical protein
MGQYYYVRIERDNKEVIFFNRGTLLEDGSEEYMLAKLMEHSYFGNSATDTVCSLLESAPAKITWVGDYADDDVNSKLGSKRRKKIYKETMEAKCVPLPHKKIDYRNKFLINTDKLEYVSFDNYLKDEKILGEKLIIHPLPLLTAIGNGQGGGDYHRGTFMEFVGSWADDRLVISKTVPKHYTELEIFFKEY